MSRGAAMAEAVVPFAPKSNSKSEAVSLTGPGKQFWGCFTKRPALPKQTTRRPSKWLTNYRLNYEPLKTG